MPMASRATTPTTIACVIRRLRCTLAASSRARSRACWRLPPLPFWVVFAGCFGTVGTLSAGFVSAASLRTKDNLSAPDEADPANSQPRHSSVRRHRHR